MTITDAIRIDCLTFEEIKEMFECKLKDLESHTYETIEQELLMNDYCVDAMREYTYTQDEIYDMSFYVQSRLLDIKNNRKEILDKLFN